MNDRGLSILEQYDLKINNSYRGRGSLICDTDKGLKLVREFRGGELKLQFHNKVLHHIKEKGYAHVDLVMENQEGALISKDRDETPYIVKDWFDARECDTRNESAVLEAVKSLACLHNTMEMPQEDQQNFEGLDLISEYERHNRELKRVRNFIKNKRKKNDFELIFMQDFTYFFEQAQTTVRKLKDSTYESYHSKCLDSGHLCHGEYNHHNILMWSEATAVTNFHRCVYDIKICDLYQFMRKILEKQNWNEKTGYIMLETYDAIRTISKEEKQCLAFQLTYPEKYWKIANHYLGSNKAWIPGKNIEKVQNLSRQKDARERFLKVFD